MNPQLYLLTNDDEFSLLTQKLEIALDSGVVSMIQIRRKRTLAMPNGMALLRHEAEKLIALAERFGVAVIMNDHVELAKALKVGVHLGQSDGSVNQARKQFGANAIIGRTCLQSPELVRQAKLDGASYAAMGAVFASPTKPQAALLSHPTLRQGCQQGIDICVIGGLTSSNICELYGLPIRYVAVVSDVLDQPVEQIAHRCASWRRALLKWHE